MVSIEGEGQEHAAQISNVPSSKTFGALVLLAWETMKIEDDWSDAENDVRVFVNGCLRNYQAIKNFPVCHILECAEIEIKFARKFPRKYRIILYLNTYIH